MPGAGTTAAPRGDPSDAFTVASNPATRRESLMDGDGRVRVYIHGVQLAAPTCVADLARRVQRFAPFWRRLGVSLVPDCFCLH